MQESANLKKIHYNSDFLQTHFLNLVLPLVHKTCNTLLHVTFLPGRIPKLGKNHTGPFCIVLVYFHVYNECLIVVWSKVMVERRGRKKGSKFGVLVPAIYGIWGCL